MKHYSEGGKPTRAAKGPVKSRSTSLYLQPEDTSKSDWMPTDDTGADRSTYSTKPMPGRNVYIGGNTSAAGGGRGDSDKNSPTKGPSKSRKPPPEAGAGDVTPPPGAPGMPGGPPLPKGYAKGGSVSASRRADGIAQRGKTRGKFV